ncbi:hypothetical protein C7S16_5844 [Burkholderia thailandensis]|uniref:Uncharacterized protein n=1 Tax=Burkholderia thailandensis TaxID=57975 RepID=A0AAW9CJH0_BURTH|nr:hypothetical protein [Burkholderia thailandensis]MDW9250640.1 hypothetical protein [Burkholderia thailandensis]
MPGREFRLFPRHSRQLRAAHAYSFPTCSRAAAKYALHCPASTSLENRLPTYFHPSK